MAERDLIINLVVKGGDTSAQQLEKVAQSEQDVAVSAGQATKALDAQSKELNENAQATAQVTKQNQSLRGQLRAIQQELAKLALAGKSNTAEYKRLRDEAGNLQDAIGDAAAEIRQAGSDTRGLDKAIRVASTATAAFGLVQGAAALFGDENEELQKSLLKVNAALTVLTSLQQIQEELSRKDSIFTAAAAKAKLLYATAVGASTGALRLFRLALLATGIGAIVVLVGVLIANWEKLSAAIGFSSKALRDNKKALNDLQASNEQYQSDLDRRIKTLQLVGATEKEIFNESTLGTKELIDRKREELRLLEEKIALEKEDLTFTEILKNAIPFRDKVLAQKEKEAEIDAAYSEQVNKLKNEITDLQLSEKKLQDDRKKSITEELKKKEEARTKALEEQNKALAEARKLADELEQSLNKLNKISFINREQINADAGSLNKLNEQINILKADLANLSPDNPEFDIVVNQLIALEKQLQKVQDASNRVAASLEIDFKKIGDAVKKAREDQEDAGETQALESFKREQERIKQIPILRARALQEEIAIRKKAGEDVSELEAELAQSRVQTANNIAATGFKFFEDIQNARLAILKNKLDQGLINEEQYAREVAEINRKQAIADKAKALFDIAINTASAIVANLKNPILAAIVAALGAAQAAIVASTPIPKFRKGGDVDILKGGRERLGELFGNSHERGGILIEAEGGEHITRKTMAKKYRPLLHAINSDTVDTFLKPNTLALPMPKRLSNSEIKSSRQAEKRMSELIEEVRFLNQYVRQGNKYAKVTADNTQDLKTAKKYHRV